MQIGKSKVFLRAGQMADLDALRSKILGKSASIIQFKIKSCIVRKKYVSVRKASIRIQSFWRGKWINKEEALFMDTEHHTIGISQLVHSLKIFLPCDLIRKYVIL